ncbi:MAG: hypothetical protein CM15mP74_16140 [Halieaceae bacterium]|nr:MAG: hypothetical protein CM15mP74_16140 [Halieaceae bacterium]
MNKAARDLGDIVGQHVPAGRIGNDEDMAGVAICRGALRQLCRGETIAVDGGVVHAFLTRAGGRPRRQALIAGRHYHPFLYKERCSLKPPQLFCAE